MKMKDPECLSKFNHFVDKLVEKYNLTLTKNEKRSKDGYDAKTDNCVINIRPNSGMIKIKLNNGNRLELYPCSNSKNFAATFNYNDTMVNHNDKFYDTTITIEEMEKIFDDNI